MRLLMVLCVVVVVCEEDGVLKREWSEYEGGPGYNDKQDGDSLIEINQKLKAAESERTLECSWEVYVPHSCSSLIVFMSSAVVAPTKRAEGRGSAQSLYDAVSGAWHTNRGSRELGGTGLIKSRTLTYPFVSQWHLQKRRDIEISWSIEPAKTQWSQLRQLIKVRGLS